MKRYQKILLSVAAIILVVVGSVHIYFTYHLDDQMKKTLTHRFHEATDDTYNLHIGIVDLELLGGQLNISNITVTKKEDATSSDLRVTIDGLNISGIGFLQFLWNRKLSLKEIEFVNPNIHFVDAGKSSESSEELMQLKHFSRRFSTVTLQVLQKVTIPRLLIRGLSVTYNRKDLPVEPYFSFQNSNIRLRDISVDSASLKDERILPSDDITATFRDIRYQTPNQLYELTAKQLDFSSQDQQLNLQSLQLQPRFNRQKFANQVPHEIDRIDMDIAKVGWEGIDISRLNRVKGIAIQHFSINNADINIYRDKRLPFPPNNNPPLPQQMIRNIPFPVNIDTLSLANGNIRYSERQPQTEEAGHIYFANLSATFTNLTNIENNWKTSPTPTLHAETDIMGKAKFEADFTFPMDTDRQQINGTLGSMDMKVLNVALEPLAFFRIDDGEIMGMDFKIELGPQNSTGSVKFRYKNFKISLLNSRSQNETFGNKLSSFLANTFKIKSDNTGTDPRVGSINFERDPQKSVFNYWWKSLLSGLKSSIGA